MATLAWRSQDRHQPGPTSEPCGWSRSVRKPPPCCRWSSKPTTARRWRARCRAIRHAQARTRHGAPPLVRSYSLSGTTGQRSLPDHVKVEPHGAAGGYLRANVDVGNRIKVAAPRGQFTLDEGAQSVVLVSAGVGVTPLLAMLHALHTDNRSRVPFGGSTARATAPTTPSPGRHGRCSRHCQTRAAACGTANRSSRPPRDRLRRTRTHHPGADRCDRNTDRQRVLPVRADRHS